MHSIYLSVVFIALMVFNLSAKAQQKVTQKDLKKLYTYMSGSFSSEEQSKIDTDYFDIRLQMKPIWRNRNNGYWLYVEQAVASSIAKPYRQRVYHVSILNDSTIQSEVYTLKKPDAAIGQWGKKNACDYLVPDSLELREGCTIYLKKDEAGNFTGSTNASDCSSNLRGATYATSKVTVTAQVLKSWDQGFDNTGKQVWGAVKGGYIFKKLRRY
jgi:CpeT protein